MTLNARKGRSKNKKQRDAADARAAAEGLAELARKRKRASGTADSSGSSPKRRKHVPQQIGRGGYREKLDVNQLDSPSRRLIERKRMRCCSHSLSGEWGHQSPGHQPSGAIFLSNMLNGEVYDTV